MFLIDHIVQEIILFSTGFLIDSQLKLASPIKFRVLIEKVAELFIRNPYPNSRTQTYMLGQQLFQAPSFLQINFCQPILHWYCVNADSPQMPALEEIIDKHANKCINFVSLKHRTNLSKERIMLA